MKNEQLKYVEELGNILIGRKDVSVPHEEYYSYGGNTKVAVDVYKTYTGYDVYAHSFFTRRKAKKCLKDILKTAREPEIKKINYYFQEQKRLLLYDIKRRIGMFFGGILMLIWLLFCIVLYGAD